MILMGWEIIKRVLKLLEGGISQTLQTATIVEVYGLSVRL